MTRMLQGEVRRKELDQTARQIVSVCLTTNEYPYIRYTANNKICADLATKVEVCSVHQRLGCML